MVSQTVSSFQVFRLCCLCIELIDSLTKFSIFMKHEHHVSGYIHHLVLFKIITQTSVVEVTIEPLLVGLKSCRFGDRPFERNTLMPGR
jgi:hypothetical protein